MISEKVWRTLTDLNEEDSIARYKSTRRKQTAVKTESGLHTFPPPFASTLRWRWAWTPALLVGVLFWIALFLFVRWLAGA